MDLTTRNAQILSDSYFTEEYALPGRTDYVEEGMPSSTYESVASFKIPERHQPDKLERTVERLEEMASRADRYRD